MSMNLIDIAVAMTSGISQEEAQRQREAMEKEEAKETETVKAEQQESGHSSSILEEVKRQIDEEVQIMSILEMKGVKNPEALVYSGQVKSVEEAYNFSALSR